MSDYLYIIHDGLAPSESKKRYMLRVLFYLEGATAYLAKLPAGYAYAAVASYVSI